MEELEVLKITNGTNVTSELVIVEAIEGSGTVGEHVPFQL